MGKQVVSIEDYKLVLAMLYQRIDDECGGESPWDYESFVICASKYGFNRDNFDAYKVNPVY